ncbi:hypothetical protein [Neobacillus drentensis]|uniref:hypothetical protein n=1 Tax=Neobacillus drentensis TaxID=220684 RepID=UPI0030004A4E
MKMVFKALSNEKLDTLKITRDFLTELDYETIILVPYGVQKIFIFEEGTGHYGVGLWSMDEELDTTYHFLSLEYAQMYASTVVKEAGLTENDIQLITKEVYLFMLRKK